jgi:hypothetical protein
MPGTAHPPASSPLCERASSACGAAVLRASEARCTAAVLSAAAAPAGPQPSDSRNAACVRVHTHEACARAAPTGCYAGALRAHALGAAWRVCCEARERGCAHPLWRMQTRVRYPFAWRKRERMRVTRQCLAQRARVVSAQRGTLSARLHQRRTSYPPSLAAARAMPASKPLFCLCCARKHRHWRDTGKSDGVGVSCPHVQRRSDAVL